MLSTYQLYAIAYKRFLILSLHYITVDNIIIIDPPDNKGYMSSGHLQVQ